MATITASRPVPAESPSQRPSSTSQAHPFTCNTCQVAFRNGDLQRTHMRSDWHRYNLKRRVASLPPLSSEIFAEKVLSAQATSSAAAAKAAFAKACDMCQKTYYSENAYQNHLGSVKHRSRLHSGKVPDDEASSVMSSTISLGEPIASTPVEPQDPEAAAEFSQVVSGMKDATLHENEPVSRRPSRPHHSSTEQRLEHPLSPAVTKTTTPLTALTTKASDLPMQRCLFCNYDSPSFKLNVTHMERIHGTFIPERDYLVDLDGLIAYLYAKINRNFECILCHKLKGSAPGIQTHMRDKGHCMIAFDTEEELIEIGQFYDFSSTYSDGEDADTPMEDGGVSLKPEASKDQDAGEDAGNGDGWETDSSASSLDSADLGALPIDHDHAYERLALHRHHSHTDPRPHRNADGFHSHAHSHHAVFHGDGRDDGDLHLPNGRVAGHRSLARYYRQNLHSHPSPEERQERRLLTEEGEDVLDRGRRQLAARPRSEMGMVGVSDARKRELDAVTKRETKKAQRQQRQFDWRVNKQGNNQKHFRDELLGKQGSG